MNRYVEVSSVKVITNSAALKQMDNCPGLSL